MALLNAAGRTDRLLATGRVLGVVCGVVVCVVAIYLLLAIPESARSASHGNLSLTHDPRIRMMPTFLGGWLAILGAFRRRALWLLLAFLVSFFPFLAGLYLLLIPPGVLSLIAYGEVGYLLSAELLRRGRAAAPARRTAS